MKKKEKFLIPFSGLKIGKHHFTFEVNDSFFDKRDYSILKQGKVCVNAVFEKKETMLILYISLYGDVVLSCNRCNDDVSLQISNEYKLIYTFGDQDTSDDAIIILPPDTYELNIEQQLYELITISIPSRVVHEKKDCNQEMLDELNKYLLLKDNNNNDSNNVDPRWSALKGLN